MLHLLFDATDVDKHQCTERRATAPLGTYAAALKLVKSGARSHLRSTKEGHGRTDFGTG